MKKDNVIRPFPPAFVSENTLAYLLDCDPSTVRAYTRSGILPPGLLIGNLRRWYWPQVEKQFAQMVKIGDDAISEDDYSSGLGNGIGRGQEELSNGAGQENKDRAA